MFAQHTTASVELVVCFSSIGQAPRVKIDPSESLEAEQLLLEWSPFDKIGSSIKPAAKEPVLFFRLTQAVHQTQIPR